MKDKFITNSGLEIPLDKVNYTFTEENPRFKDTFWTQYTLPIDLQYDPNFQRKIGHFSSLFSRKHHRYHEGIHIFEGRRRKGKLEILNFGKDKIQVQIDSGFENLPNFDKPLKDLPLANFPVDDIYEHANLVCTKKYPETNYNFPKIYTDEYNLEDEAWKYFDSMINNRTLEPESAGKIFPKNRVENGLDVYNKNIIHPMPYILYVLKVGFKDAGFNLSGDVLNDVHLYQRCLFSDKKYYDTGEQKEHKVNIFEDEFTDIHWVNTPEGNAQFGKLSKRIEIKAPGSYRLLVDIRTTAPPSIGVRANYSGCKFSAKKNGEIIWEVLNDNTRPKLEAETTFDISEDEALEGVVLNLDYIGTATLNRRDQEGVNIGVATLKINPRRQHTKEGAVIPYIFNVNRVDLRKAVPEMTFGELVTIIKNWRNYDLIFSGNTAIMDLIKIDSAKEPQDFRKFEVENPNRSFTDKQFFNLKFPDSESVVKNIFFDENGYHLNKNQVPENTTEIGINAFCLKLTSFRGAFTAKAERGNALMLVYYDGLDANGDNHAKNPPGLEGEHCARHLLPWFLNRLTNFNYKWTFVANKNHIRSYNIRSDIFCYGRRHWIKSWTKKSVGERLYYIEIETETY